MELSAAAPRKSRQMLDRSLAKRDGRLSVARVAALAIGLVLLLAVSFVPSSGYHSSRPSPTLSSLPNGLQAVASATLGAASSAYAASPVRAGFAAENPV